MEGMGCLGPMMPPAKGVIQPQCAQGSQLPAAAHAWGRPGHGLLLLPLPQGPRQLGHWGGGGEAVPLLCLVH